MSEIGLAGGSVSHPASSNPEVNYVNINCVHIFRPVLLPLPDIIWPPPSVKVRIST